MRGSWAGANGTYPVDAEVWLNVDGLRTRTEGVVAVASPMTRLASSARFLVNRGKYHRGEHWGL